MAGRPKTRAKRLAAAAEEERKRLAALKPPPKAMSPATEDWIDDTLALPPASPVAALETLQQVHAEAEILPSGRVRMEDGTLLEQEQFDTLVKLSFDRARDIMEIKFDPGAEKAHQILTRQTTIISSVMTTLARIDEARLRAVRQSKYEKILDAIRRARELA